MIHEFLTEWVGGEIVVAVEAVLLVWFAFILFGGTVLLGVLLECLSGDDTEADATQRKEG